MIEESTNLPEESNEDKTLHELRPKLFNDFLVKILLLTIW